MAKKRTETWLRAESEGHIPYEAFEKYRDMGPSRSVDKAYRNFMVQKGKRSEEEVTSLSASGRWWEWYKRFNWGERAQAWDAHNEYMRAIEQEEARKEMATRHAGIAMMAQNKIIQRLQSLRPEDLSPRDCITWLDIAVKVERLSRGESTVNVQQRIEIGRKADEELDALRKEALKSIKEAMEQFGISRERAVEIASRAFDLPKETLMLPAPEEEGPNYAQAKDMVIDGEFEIVTEDEDGGEGNRGAEKVCHTEGEGGRTRGGDDDAEEGRDPEGEGSGEAPAADLRLDRGEVLRPDDSQRLLLGLQGSAALQASALPAKDSQGLPDSE